MDELRELEARLDVDITDYGLLQRALTHRSYLNESGEPGLEDNERLEFLGDAVLDFVVGAYLYARFPEMDEGELTSLRAALVRTRTLAGFARQLELGRSLRLGYGEEESGGRDRTPTLCAAFEAVIGAIYLDQGFDAVQELMERLMEPALQDILDQSCTKMPAASSRCGPRESTTLRRLTGLSPKKGLTTPRPSPSKSCSAARSGAGARAQQASSGAGCCW
jgi:ribonuclease III